MRKKWSPSMFYFMMCVWQNGDELSDCTRDIFEKLYIRNKIYWTWDYIEACLDY